VFDKKKEKHYLYEKKVSPNKLKLANNIWESKNEYQDDSLKIIINNNLKEGFINVVFEGKEKEETPNLKANLTGYFNDTDQLVSSIPFSKNKGMYSHKSFVPMDGFIELNNKKETFNKTDSFFVVDDHKGYYPYRMKWDWISTGFYQDEKLIGLNLTVNQAVNSEKYNENRIWIDGKINKLPLVKFTRQEKVWIIESDCKNVQLLFYPLYPKNVKINLGILGGSDYQGPFGRVTGVIKINNERIEINQEFAFAEKQYIRC
jgi:hypothetical protein